MIPNKSNFYCLVISILPFLFSLFIYTRMIAFPSTHLFADNSNNPAEIDKPIFEILILLSSVGFYFLSLVVSRYLYVISTKINVVYFRYIFGGLLSFLTFILILRNLR